MHSSLPATPPQPCKLGVYAAGSCPGPATPGSTTPSQQTQQQAAAAMLGASAASKVHLQHLPEHLSSLHAVLRAVYTTMPLVRARGQVTTDATLRAPIESMLGRALRLEQLRQIKALYPDAFSWQYVNAPAACQARLGMAGGMPSKEDEQQQLLLGVVELDGGGSGGGDAVGSGVRVGVFSPVKRTPVKGAGHSSSAAASPGSSNSSTTTNAHLQLFQSALVKHHEACQVSGCSDTQRCPLCGSCAAWGIMYTAATCMCYVAMRPAAGLKAPACCAVCVLCRAARARRPRCRWQHSLPRQPSPCPAL